MAAENTPSINYLNNENWGMVTLFYGFDTEDLHKIEKIMKDKLMEIAVENNYSEINIITTDFTLDGWVRVIYKFVPIK